MGFVGISPEVLNRRCDVTCDLKTILGCIVIPIGSNAKGRICLWLAESEISQLVGIHRFLHLDKGDGPDELLGGAPHRVSDNLVEGRILVRVVQPELCQWQVEVGIHVPELPVVLLQKWNGTGLHPLVQSITIVIPSTIELEGEILLVWPKLQDALLTEHCRKDELSAHESCNFLEERKLGAGLGREPTKTSCIFLLDWIHLASSFQNLHCRQHVLLETFDQIAVSVRRLQFNWLLIGPCEDLVRTAEGALRTQAPCQLPLLSRVKHCKGQLLPLGVLLSFSLCGLCCLDK
mmetsp:Transcript_44310/g.77757  ORF Transcript_44310/g.77757 Transcript_44310/m.77757 type:complete len:291 (+) Transcript_44310:681-1553(+)